MSRGAYEKKVFQFLGIPETGKGDYIEAGEFCPADSPELVKSIAALRLRHLQEIYSKAVHHPENLAMISNMMFHSYPDFLFTLRNAEPKKGDNILPGHSLNRYSADIDGYLAHICEKDPNLERFFFAKMRVRIREMDRKKHTYITGGSGSGKSTLLKLLIYSYLRKPGYCTTIVFDPAGDFASQVAEWKDNGLGDNLIYIDPYLKDGFTPTINPFEVRNTSPQGIDILSQELLSVFAEILQKTGFTNQMEALLVPCLSVILNTPGATLADLQRFMDDDLNDDLVQRGRLSKNTSHKNFFDTKFLSGSYKNTKDSLYTKLQSLLNSHTFYNLVVGKSTLDVPAILDSRKLVVFNLAKGRLGKDTSHAFGRFVIALIQAYALQRVNIPERRRVPVHLFIDEFQNYVSPSVETILVESRKFGLHMTLAQQFLGQGMDTVFRKAVLGNTEVKIVGKNSRDTLVPMSKEIGIDEEFLYRLSQGRFYVKCAEHHPFKLHVPAFIADRHLAMPFEQWQTVVERQIEQYYRSTKTTEAADTEPEAVNIEGVNPEEIQPKTERQEPQKSFRRKKRRLPDAPKYGF
jgi:energy-coupling factor transporter ATP-binding protein EcfA2